MSLAPTMIDEPTATTAWCRAFQHVYGPKTKHGPMLVCIGGTSDDPLEEDVRIPHAIDVHLANLGRRITCKDVASTIFPADFTNVGETPEQSFVRWKRAYPRLRKRATRKRLCGNRYHHRMVAYGETAVDKGDNQLLNAINNWNAGNHNSMCLQIALLDPRVDRMRSRQLSFPCLQQLGITTLQSKAGYDLTLSAFYPAQNIVDRAYGNYRGLCQLGIFMASHMNSCHFSRLNCFIARPTRGIAKYRIAQIMNVVNAHLIDVEANRTS